MLPVPQRSVCNPSSQQRLVPGLESCLRATLERWWGGGEGRVHTYSAEFERRLGVYDRDGEEPNLSFAVLRAEAEIKSRDAQETNIAIDQAAVFKLVILSWTDDSLHV